MVLTTKQCDLLLNIFNASLTRAAQSGIPIGKEYYEDLNAIKEKIYKELREAVLREGGSKS